MSKENKVNRRDFMKKTVLAGATVAAAGALGSPASNTGHGGGRPAKVGQGSRCSRGRQRLYGLGRRNHGIGSRRQSGHSGKSEERARRRQQQGLRQHVVDADDRRGRIHLRQGIGFGTTDDESIRAYEAEHVKLNDWLSSKFGVKPAGIGGLFQPEHPELPGNDCVRTWGNGGQTLNGQLYAPIRAYADKAKIEFMYDTPAKELVQSPAGEILGVKAEADGKPFFIKANRGVVLGCGGFEFDFDMAKQFLPGWPVYGRGTPYNTGDGIRMCQKAGAALWHMNNTLGGFGCLMVPEYRACPRSISGCRPMAISLLDKFGRRFMNEKRDNRHGFGHKEYQLFFDGILADFTRNPWWTVFDDATAKKGPVAAAGGTKFTWFNAHMGYKWSDDNSAEVGERDGSCKGGHGRPCVKMQVDPNVLVRRASTNTTRYCKNKADPDLDGPAASLDPAGKGAVLRDEDLPRDLQHAGRPEAQWQVPDLGSHSASRFRVCTAAAKWVRSMDGCTTAEGTTPRPW